MGMNPNCRTARVLWSFGIVPRMFPSKDPCPLVIWEMFTVLLASLAELGVVGFGAVVK